MDSNTSFGDVKNDLSQMKQDVSKLADDATKTAKDGMNATWDSARKVADQVQEGHHKVCEYASSHPTAALLIAVGIGAIAGRLLARRF
jgi:ElaB/YqjD/DUF883 family membrane-anchored ribosome-binding protein